MGLEEAVKIVYNGAGRAVVAILTATTFFLLLSVLGPGVGASGPEGGISQHARTMQDMRSLPPTSQIIQHMMKSGKWMFNDNGTYLVNADGITTVFSERGAVITWHRESLSRFTARAIRQGCAAMNGPNPAVVEAWYATCSTIYGISVSPLAIMPVPILLPGFYFVVRMAIPQLAPTTGAY